MKRSLFWFTCVSEDEILGKNLPHPITPDDMKVDETDLKEAIIEFNRLLKKKLKGDKMYNLCSNIIFSDGVCKLVDEAYKKAGWRFVHCRREFGGMLTEKTMLRLVR